MLRDDFDLRLTNELIETYLKIAYGIMINGNVF